MNKKLDVVILCGGMGTRFQSVSRKIPKSMIEMGGRPFLDIIIDFFYRSGFRRFILCTGYLSDYIEQYYKKSPYFPDIVFSKEQRPLGTGGAVKLAQNLIKTENFLVLNGDSYCETDLNSFVDFHFNIFDALVSIALTCYDGRIDAGNVSINENNQAVVAFYEKGDQHGQFISAGQYIISKKIFDYIPDNQMCSLEYSIFPQFINKGLYGFVTNSPVIDIGTPERHLKALTFFAGSN